LIYKYILKPLFFLIEAEKAHHLVMYLLSLMSKFPGGKSIIKRMYGFEHRSLEKNLMGLQFPNAIGLAAGFDKDGIYCNDLKSLGFGFIEVGTVTPRSQPGNDKPRLFRLIKDEAIINRMGFNNRGVHHLVQQLKALKKDSIIIGGNIGKNKNTENKDAIEDYLFCFKALFDCVDYFVVNVSSPNTPGLRELQDKEPLMALLQTLVAENNKYEKPKPILLKIAPDLTHAQLNDVAEIVQSTGISGLIATNTTLDRSLLSVDKLNLDAIGAGGLSGKPLSSKSTEVIKYLRSKLPKPFVIIGVGGIHSAHDALEKIHAGADLIQMYTGFIFEGPSLIKQIKKGLLNNQI
jgi:dihydroorotate dehydrogenase